MPPPRVRQRVRSAYDVALFEGCRSVVASRAFATGSRSAERRVPRVGMEWRQAWSRILLGLAAVSRRLSAEARFNALPMVKNVGLGHSVEKPAADCRPPTSPTVETRAASYRGGWHNFKRNGGRLAVAPAGARRGECHPASWPACCSASGLDCAARAPRACLEVRRFGRADAQGRSYAAV